METRKKIRNRFISNGSLLKFRQPGKETKASKNLCKEKEITLSIEKQKLLAEWNDTAAEFPTEGCIHNRFEEQVQKNPGKTALVFADQHLTYQELDKRSTGLASVLKEQGVKPDSLVGMCVRRSLDMIIGVIGTLKAGGTYVPVDPAYPQARIGYILEDSRVKILLIREMEEKIQGLPGLKDIKIMKIDRHQFHMEKTKEKPGKVMPHQLAYAIYTSGSTGKPKGVLVEHRQILNTLDAMQRQYPVEEDDRYLLKTNCVFDVSITELFSWFLGSGRLVILEPGQEKEPPAILKTVLEKQVTHINFAPSMCVNFVDTVPGSDLETARLLKYVMVAGEAFPGRLALESPKKFAPGVKIENIYGPTEISIYGTWFPVNGIKDSVSSIPIGKPLYNVQAYILSPGETLQPIEIPGELHISGAGVARGYLNRAELTGEKFIDNPFSGGTRMYKTGDLARWLADGNIEFLGRMDHQVKIRGIRIECGEIEAEFIRHPQVQETVVIARTINNTTQLVAYYVAVDKNTVLAIDETRSYLKEKLPEYMIPAAFVPMKAIPLTSSGKVDRKTLLEQEVKLQSSREYRAPRTTVEKQLAGIWEQVLGISRVGIDDNFFELGGHSLLGTRIISRINKELGVDLRLGKLLYGAASIKELAMVISEANPYRMVPIDSIQRPDQLPLSYAQERIWFLAQLGSSEQYHVPDINRITGDLDEEALQKTMDFIVSRHENLRTGFKAMGGKARQFSEEVVDIEIKKRDLIRLSKDRQDRESQTIIREFIRQPFHLEHPPLMRVLLIKLDSTVHILGLCLHHIIFDGWSMGILTREISQAYTAYTNGKEPGLAGLKIQYADYAVWQRQVLTEEKLENELSYWKNRLAGYEDLNLPTDYPRPGQLSGKGGHVRYKIEEETARRLKKRCRDHQITLFTAITASVYLLLTTYSRQQDICLGFPAANRNHWQIEDLIGFFVNTLVIRIHMEIERDLTVEQLLKHVRAGIVEAQERQALPFEKVVETMQPRRDLSRSPIFQVLVNYVNTRRDVLQLVECQWQEMDFDYEVSKFDLTFDFGDETDGGLRFNLEYSRDLFEEETIRDMGEHLVKIMHNLGKKPGQAAFEIELLTAGEKHRLLVEWNDTTSGYPVHQCIHELFAGQARKTPDYIAAVTPTPGPQEQHMYVTYRELNRRSNRLAHLLRSKYIGNHTTVAIMTEPGLEMIAAVLAVLKCGACYLPIDPVNPGGRINYLLTDSQAKLLLTPAKPAEKAGIDSKTVEILDIGDESLYTYHISGIASPKGKPGRPGEPAYMIYTSGTTGKPKGVLVTHENLVNYVTWFSAETGLSTTDKTVLTSSFAFDLGYTSVYPCLLRGAQLHILAKENYMLAKKLIAYIRRHGITYIKMTPTLFSAILEEPDFSRETYGLLRMAILGGEAIIPAAVEKALETCSHLKIMNHYGPTEATIGCIARFIEPDDTDTYKTRPTIGKPINNTTVFILDRFFRVLPIGVAGELCLGGTGVARGYLNHPELTSEKFVGIVIDDRSLVLDSRKNLSKAGKNRLYRTGDLARWMRDGNILFLGRIDRQVKVRGFRIECGEIEAELIRHKNIQDAVVLIRMINHAMQLAAFYVADNKSKALGQTLETGELRSYLQEKLPGYMIPGFFVSLEEIPLTPNGKVDRKILMHMEVGPGSKQDYVPPRTGTEMRLAGIWEEVLSLERVGIFDNFFESGGHSLLGTRIIARINREFSIDIPLRILFEAPCIKSLAGIIAESVSYGAVPISSIRRPEQLPLSYAQERLWFLAQLGFSEQYHVPKAVKVIGNLDEEALQKAINYIVRRHENLRTGFKTVGGKVIQVISSSRTVNIGIEKRDLSWLSREREKEEQGRVCENIIREFVRRPFLLEQVPLLRIILVKLETAVHILGICLHHIISDAWSRGILFREITLAYAAYKNGKEPGLEPLKIHYGDYAVWQREVMSEAKLEKETNYWKQHLAGYKDLDFPGDYPRPRQISGKGGQVIYSLDGQQVRQLRKQCREKQITLFTVLMTGVYILLKGYSRQEDICLGMPVANRNRQEIENIVGFFVNTLVIRINTEEQPDITCGQLLKKVQEEIVIGQERGDVPFEKIVEILQPARDMSRAPIFQVIVNYVITGREPLQLADSQLEEVDFDYGISKFDLLFDFSDREDDSLRITIEYSRDLYKIETIERMAGHLHTIINSLREEPGRAIDEIELLAGTEKQMLLVEWNDTAAPYPRDTYIHELFREQARKAPEKTAVVFEDQQLTFRELEERSNKLAAVLQTRGVKSGSLVGICLGRSIEMITGILGILKTGSGYVPIEPEYPPARIKYMLEDGDVNVLLVLEKPGQRMSRLFPGKAIKLIAPDMSRREIKSQSGKLPGQTPCFAPAYVIYTSGSTGQPKGVMVEHCSVNRLVINTNYISISEGDIFMQYAPISFDAATLEIWAPLLNGARLDVAPAGRLSLADLESFVEKQRVTIAWLTAPLFQSMVEERIGFFKTLNTILAGGDVLPAEAVKKLSKRYSRLQIINGYGPTENTTFTCCYRVNANKVQTYQKIPIGAPISNTSVYILNQKLKPVPIGVPGELYTGGDGLARGYLNNPELTAEKFRHRKTVETNNKKFLRGSRGQFFQKEPPGRRRLYKTGDLARWLPDRNIEFFGRKDHQVKLRGFRIECGEIEARLCQHPGIQEAVVIAVKVNNDSRLIAYYTAPKKDDTYAGLETDETRDYLQQTLPEYMIPAAFVQLEAIPLTPNGKVDRKALSMREIELQTSQEYAAPRTGTEKRLAKIWEEVLGVDRVGINDNFFRMGGHSLLAIQIISRINRELGLEVLLHQLFEAPSIKGLSRSISGSNRYQAAVIGSGRRPARVPLSYAQERLWFLAQLGYSGQYHVSRVMKITGHLDEATLKKTFGYMSVRHEILRTGFKAIDGKAFQVIAEAADIEIEQRDISGLSREEQGRENQTIIRDFIQRPFELEKSPLLRVVLIKLDAAVHILGMCLHHIIVDAWSMEILTGEITRVYAAYREGREPGLEPLKIQYADYAVWQRQVMTDAALDKELSYWKDYLSGREDLDMPVDYPRPRQVSGRGGQVKLMLRSEEVKQLNNLCREEQTTLFTVFMTGVYLLLRRYSRQEDICLGMPAANRNHQEIEGLLGFFVNTLAIRINTEAQGNMTIRQLLKGVKEEMVAGQERQNIPFEKIVETMQPDRDLSRAPIFQVMVNYIHSSKEQLQLGECQLVEVDFDYGTSKFDLTFAFTGREDGSIEIILEYSRDLFAVETIGRMGEHLVKIINCLNEDPGKTPAEIELVGEEEKQTLLSEWNNTGVEYHGNHCIHELFMQQVLKTPEKVAIVFADWRLTYRELDIRSTNLAIYLQLYPRIPGINPDSLVGICLERSIEMIVGILGILKAGAGYLPVDPAYPATRIRYMLKDSGVKIVLTQESLQEKMSELLGKNKDSKIISLDKHRDEIIGVRGRENIKPNVRPHDLAYVIYTSGSTGKPKGVPIEHSSVINFSQWHTHQIKLSQNDISTLFASFGFDASVLELFPYLLNGNTLHLIDDPLKHNLETLNRYFESNKITISFMPTQTCEQFFSLDNRWLRILLTGGDQLSRFPGKGVPYTVYNNYGPTENTVVSSCSKIDPAAGKITIGKPIHNTQYYILAENLTVVPIGVPGELYISGAGIARGYLNRPELTVEKFIGNPFKPGTKMYMSGDLARWLSDGNVEFLGRIDHQVKIRGFRIECGEIETVLTGDPRIQDAVVIPGTINNTRQLIAYYTVREQHTTLETGEIRSRLQEKLPDYMIPAAFVALEAIPLTPNGKVDRKALQKREVEVQSTREYIAPRTETEKQLAGIWQQVLGIKRVGIHDNFFQLGGHSLLAARIISRINRELAVAVPLRSLFEAPEIEGLSGVIKELAPGQVTRIGSITRPEQLPLSYAQERLWYLVQLGYGQQYHVPSVMKIRGDLNPEALQKAFDYILARHENLRTGFKTVEHRAIQVIARDAAIGIEHSDLSGLSKEEQNRESQIILREFIHKPFSLENPPLMRVVLIKLKPAVHILGMCLHHIVFDGWSMGILTGEISRAYTAFRAGKEPGLAQLKVQYADYAVWQREIMTPARLDNELNWWKQHLSGYEDLHLPIDFPRPGQLSGQGGYVTSGLGKVHTRQLKTLCREKQVTLFTVFITGVYLMLSRYSRQEDICLGFPAANRDHQEIEDLVGFFVNTLVVRIDTGEEEQERLTGEQLLQRVQDNIVAAQDRQNVPFEKVVEILQPNRDLSRSPIFQVLVNYVNIPGETLQLGDCILEDMDFDYGTAKFDLTASFSERENRDININLVYSRDLFTETTARRMSGHLVKIITGLLDEPGKRPDEIELLTGQEKQTLLIDWNDTTAPYPKDKCIHELFEKQVRKGPGKVACILADRHLSYRELNERSTCLAINLQGKGVGPDVCVGICLERSLEMITSIMGILKAGGAYVPIDAGYPAERIQYMLEDSSARILVTSGSLEKKVKEIKKNPEIIYIDSLRELNFSSSHLLNFSTSASTDLAYVIYTSGSTGKPKGVMVQHDSVVNYLNVVKNKYGFDDIDDIDIGEFNFSFLGNFVFDAVATSFLTPLISGSACIIYDEQEEQQEIILKALNDPRVQVIKLTPSHIQLIRDSMPVRFQSKKILIIGGESLKKSLVYELLNNNSDNIYCINQYGPTECTIASTAHLYKRDINYGNEIYIGGPIANTQVYILNKSKKAVPVVVPGELYIGGDGLARGYLNQPGLTSEKFINEENLGPIYRTGDLGRWLGDGNIEFLGRIDHQVKIRGFRIECGEIEYVLIGHPCIQDAVVLARQINQTMQLTAYLVVDRESKKIETGEIRGYLQEKLPDYMIPVAFILLEAIPLTPSGKIDRKTLLKQEIELTGSREYAGPRTETEVQLVKIWKNVLGVERVGIYDNFFELGGHSLLATRIMSGIKQELKVDVPLRKLFEFPCIEGLSMVIEGSAPVQAVPIASIRRPGQIPLSYAQERLWFLVQLGYGELYHVPKVVKVIGALDEKALQQAIDFTAARHETLRTGFRTVDGRAIQVIAERAVIGIEKRNLSGIGKKQQETECQAIIREFVQTPFQLAQAPLVRAILIKLAPEVHIFGLCLHHIISDGWSGGILTREISQAYAAFREGREPGLEPLKIQYADYAVWQREVMTEERLDKELRYWKEHLAGYEDLDLPGDYPRPKEISGKGGHFESRLHRKKAGQLRRQCRENQVTIFTLFMTGIYLLLRQYSRQEDICLGMPVANRNYREIEDIVGFFVNTLVVRVNTGGRENITVAQLLHMVREEIIAGQDRQNVPFEKIVEIIQPTRDLSRTPIFQVLVNYVNTGREALQLGDSRLEGVDFDYGMSKFDLLFHLSDMEDGSFEITIEYSRDLFAEGTIERMSGHLVRFIGSLLENPGQLADTIELLTGEEKHRLLIEWNDTAADYPGDQCLHGLFMEQVKKTPLNAAVVLADQFLSYRELDERSTGLAAVLKKQGIIPDDLVGVCLERSLETIVAILGILKAGGAYMPMDVEYPETRIRYMLEESKTKILLTTDKLHDELKSVIKGNVEQQAELLLQIITVEAGVFSAGEFVSSLPLSPFIPVNLSYIIYTSGSMGKPKGVMQTHRTIVNLIAFQRGEGVISPAGQYTDQRHVAQFAAHGFDVSMQEIFYAFLGGDVLYIIPGEIKQSPVEVVNFVSSRQINMLYLPTAYLEYFAEEVNTREKIGISNLKRIIVAGEALKISLSIKEFFTAYSHICLENQYGPSETHVVTSYILPGDTGQWSYTPPIGNPIANIRIDILNRVNQPVPVGVPGELFLSGDGLARGYLNNPSLTSRKFRHHVINKKFLRGFRMFHGRYLQKEPPGRRRQYRTGDLARWLPERNLEFLGRIDLQVKVRGFRVECGEIEAELARYPGIREVVVIDRVINDTTQLIAYYVAKDKNRVIEVNELRSHLQLKLPDYMVPGAFVSIEAIPLNANGKVDRKHLSRQEVEVQGGREYVAARTETEKQLVGIWENVLNRTGVGINDNFFDLGGHSLLAIRIISRINKEFGVNVPLRKLFEAPNIKALSGIVAGSEHTSQADPIAAFVESITEITI